MKPKTRQRWAWNAWDDEDLRKLWAQGKSDPEIAIEMDRHRQMIYLHRKKLGLPGIGKAGSPPGWKHTPEARAKVSEANRRRWQMDPTIRAKVLQNLSRGPEGAKKKRFWPQRGTPEYRLYRKLVAALGPAVARAEFQR
jgi:hypothetical protein